MTDIETRLATYAALDPDQRAEVDAYVLQHPEWAEQHSEAQAFAALLDAATSDVPESAPDKARLDALAAEAEDPVAKFERLTGRALRSPVLPEGDGQPVGFASSLAPGRPGAHSARSGRPLVRWAATALAGVAVAYAGLYAISAASLSERTQLASLSELSSYEAPVFRGDASAALAERLDAALGRVDDARQSTLGLFPRYDDDALADVAAILLEIAEVAEAETAVSQEARFALGRVYLQQGRDADAARVLGTLVREGSYRGPEARRLLDYVRAQDDR